MSIISHLNELQYLRSAELKKKAIDTISVNLTTSEKDVENHHVPNYPWPGLGVKRWRGEGEVYSFASILSFVIYERGPNNRLVVSSGTSLLWNGQMALCEHSITD